MWKYKGTENRVQIGDHVLVSEKWAKDNKSVHRCGVVIRLQGFITVRVVGFGEVDFDARSLTFERREN